MKTKLKHCLTALTLFALGIPKCLHATTFTVTTANISGPGSLPVAIIQANMTPGRNQIKISETNVITLGLQLPVITNSVAISGVGAGPSFVSGGGTLPLFTFASGTTNSLSNLVLANGSTAGNGAAINNSGTLTVDGCIITNNSANNGSGGAIINNGVMTVSASVISGNQAGTGGAVYNSSVLTLNNSQFSANQAQSGGAIFNVGSLAAMQLTLSNNIATAGFGGGIYNNGPLAITQSTFLTNSTTGAQGQFGVGEPSVSGCGGGGGGGGGFGGALFTFSANVGITNSTFFQNAAFGGECGGTYNDYNTTVSSAGNGGGNAGGIGGTYGSPIGGAGGFGSGGGGGDGYFSTEPPYSGVTGAGGSGGFGGGSGGSGGTTALGIWGGGGSGFGGAILIQSGSLFLVDCTITINSCVGGNGLPQGQGCAGGVYNYGGSVTLLNTIIAGNNVATSSPDLTGSFLSSGDNLIGNNQGATGLSIFDFQNVAASLGPLRNNGGPTLTCVPLAGSYAIGYGTSSGAPKTDQRGVPRPQNGGFDIGAVQVVTGSPIIIGASMNKGSGFSLTTIFDAANSYRIQASTNLTTWINLATNGSGGALQFSDTGATNLSRRFYRTATP